MVHTRPPSADATGPPDKDGAYNVRSVPVRIYLPDGPALQDLVPPLLENGTPNTLSHLLTTHVPLLFPPPFSNTPNIAFALIQGVLAPPETEMAWLGACLAGADGWVNICVGVFRDTR
jgi:autophagy-related protein 5